MQRKDLWIAPACEAGLLLIVGLAGWASRQPMLFARMGPHSRNSTDVLATLLLRATQPAALSTFLLIALGSMQKPKDAAVIMGSVVLVVIVGQPLRSWRLRTQHQSGSERRILNGYARSAGVSHHRDLASMTRPEDTIDWPGETLMQRTRMLWICFLLFTGSAGLQAQNAASSPRTDMPSYTGGASQPLRVAIVGLEHGHVEGLLRMLPQHPEVQLVGIADADSNLVAKYRGRFNLSDSLFFKSEADMIEARRPAAVLVYTSIAQHRPAIDIAAQYGVSVMVEKPLTLSYEDALHMQEVAKRFHIQVLTNYETTWYASNRAASDELQRGDLGPLRKLVVHDGHQGPKEIGVPPEFLSWLTDPAQNGAGALYDFGCYGVDLATWLMHGEIPETVTAVLNHDKPDIYRNVDDDATVILKYPQAQVIIMASWNWPFGRKDMEVYGATGYVITVESNGLRVRHQHDTAEHVESAPALPTMERDSLSYLAAVLSGKIQPKRDLSSLETNVEVIQILDAARQSARTGQSVRLR